MKVRRLLLVLLILLCPLRANYPVYSAKFSSIDILPIDIILAVSLFYMTARWATNSQKNYIYIARSWSIFAVLTLWSGFTILWAHRQIVGITHATYWVRALTLIFVITNLVKTKQDFLLAIQLFIVSVILNSFFSVAQWVNQGSFKYKLLVYLGQSSPEISTKLGSYYAERGVNIPLYGNMSFGPFAGGLVGGGYALAAVLELVLPLILFLYLYDEKSLIFNQFYLLIFIVSGLFSVLISLSRGALISVFAGTLLFLLIFTIRKKAWRMYTGNSWTIFHLVPLFVAALVLLPIIIPKIMSPEFAASLSTRLNKYISSINAFTESPIIGHGLGSAPYVVDASIPNNMLLAYLVDMGVIGFVLFLAFLWSVFQSGALVVNKAGKILSIISFGLMASIFCFLLHAQADWIYRKINTMPMLYLAISLVLSARKIIPQTPSSTHPRAT